MNRLKLASSDLSHEADAIVEDIVSFERKPASTESLGKLNKFVTDLALLNHIHLTASWLMNILDDDNERIRFITSSIKRISKTDDMPLAKKLKTILILQRVMLEYDQIKAIEASLKNTAERYKSKADNNDLADLDDLGGYRPELEFGQSLDDFQTSAALTGQDKRSTDEIKELETLYLFYHTSLRHQEQNPLLATSRSKIIKNADSDFKISYNRFLTEANKTAITQLLDNPDSEINKIKARYQYIFLAANISDERLKCLAETQDAQALLDLVSDICQACSRSSVDIKAAKELIVILVDGLKNTRPLIQALYQIINGLENKDKVSKIASPDHLMKENLSKLLNDKFLHKIQ